MKITASNSVSRAEPREYSGAGTGRCGDCGLLRERHWNTGDGRLVCVLADTPSALHTPEVTDAK